MLLRSGKSLRFFYSAISANYAGRKTLQALPYFVIAGGFPVMELVDIRLLQRIFSFMYDCTCRSSAAEDVPLSRCRKITDLATAEEEEEEDFSPSWERSRKI